MFDPFSDLKQKFLFPLFQAADIFPQDAEILVETWVKIILAEAIMKAVESFPQTEAKSLIEKIKSLPSQEEKINAFNKSISSISVAKEAVEKYFKDELPKTLKLLSNCFVDNATPEQKTKLKELLLQKNH